MPEFITCMHEDSSVAMANGYAKIEGKPVLVCVHGTVGLQHAAMSVYNAYCDQAAGDHRRGKYFRRGRAARARSNGSTARRISRPWCATLLSGTTIRSPCSTSRESFVRGYQLAMTPPMMPVVLTADGVLQEDPIPNRAELKIPKLGKLNPPAGDMGAVNDLAKMLVAAENPLIIASRSARTPEGLRLLVELAEALQCGVVDQQRRMNFPSRHPLSQTLRTRGAITDADFILGLEIYDFYGTIHALGGQVKVIPRSLLKPGAKLASISSSDLFYKSNYQNFQRYQEVDFSIAADAEATLPALIEAVKRLSTADRKQAFQARGAKLREASLKALEQTRTDATYAWDASPISTARMSAELYNAVKNEDWSFVSDPFWVSNWPLKLWDFNKHYQFIGGAGGEGVGYLAPATVGAAVANKKHGRLSVSIQSDGDMMYANGVLWTAAHHRIPLLILMHNNRAYHQEIMQLQRMANQHNRGVERCGIGTTITDPNIDYAKLAQSMGVRAEGPMADPNALGAAIRRGVEVVKRGDPYLIDVITQPR